MLAGCAWSGGDDDATHHLSRRQLGYGRGNGTVDDLHPASARRQRHCNHLYLRRCERGHKHGAAMTLAGIQVFVTCCQKPGKIAACADWKRIRSRRQIWLLREFNETQTTFRNGLVKRHAPAS